MLSYLALKRKSSAVENMSESVIKVIVISFYVVVSSLKKM